MEVIVSLGSTVVFKIVCSYEWLYAIYEVFCFLFVSQTHAVNKATAGYANPASFSSEFLFERVSD